MDLHQYFVKAVVKDLEVQNGTNFEYMCQPLMETRNTGTGSCFINDLVF